MYQLHPGVYSRSEIYSEKLGQHMVEHFTEMHWLSWLELRVEVKGLMEDGRMDVPEFNDLKWVLDFAFLVYFTQELDILKHIIS